MTIAPAPTAPAERIGMLDALRGIAVLGILIMNITGFGLPLAYDDPTNWGGAEGANLTAWLAAALFFEGTMRGIFTLLFGAGALLFLQHHAQSARFLYFRRMGWLILFGLLNAYVLLWPGDILFYYGVVGLLLFFFRKMSPRRLIVAAAIAMTLQTAITAVEWYGHRQASIAARAAEEAKAAGKVLSQEQRAAIATFASINARFKPSHAYLQDRVSQVRHGYLSALRVYARETWYLETAFFIRHGLLESLGMMLLGMALLQLGVLTGTAPERVYGLLMCAGYAVGLSVNLFEAQRLIGAGFAIETLIASYLTYDLGRIPLTLGHLGLIGLVYRTQAASAVMLNLAAVGRMALTNYLAQSLICMVLFTGAGFALYGRLERHELYYVVAAIWTAQLLWSPWWLRQFRFGPVEWLWRSLTYWSKQPMKEAAPDKGLVTGHQ